jgi:hypothetical protein
LIAVQKLPQQLHQVVPASLQVEGTTHHCCDQHLPDQQPGAGINVSDNCNQRLPVLRSDAFLKKEKSGAFLYPELSERSIIAHKKLT